MIFSFSFFLLLVELSSSWACGYAWWWCCFRCALWDWWWGCWCCSCRHVVLLAGVGAGGGVRGTVSSRGVVVLLISAPCLEGDA